MLNLCNHLLNPNQYFFLCHKIRLSFSWVTLAVMIELHECNSIGLCYLLLIEEKDNFLILHKQIVAMTQSLFPLQFISLLDLQGRERKTIILNNWPMEPCSSAEKKPRARNGLWCSRKWEMGKIHRPEEENICHFISKSQEKDFWIITFVSFQVGW